jgi:ABC-type sugar transport system ATPase subunit
MVEIAKALAVIQAAILDEATSALTAADVERRLRILHGSASEG